MSDESIRLAAREGDALRAALEKKRAGLPLTRSETNELRELDWQERHALVLSMFKAALGPAWTFRTFRDTRVFARVVAVRDGPGSDDGHGRPLAWHRNTPLRPALEIRATGTIHLGGGDYDSPPWANPEGIVRVHVQAESVHMGNVCVARGPRFDRKAVGPWAQALEKAARLTAKNLVPAYLAEWDTALRTHEAREREKRSARASLKAATDALGPAACVDGDGDATFVLAGGVECSLSLESGRIVLRLGDETRLTPEAAKKLATALSGLVVPSQECTYCGRRGPLSGDGSERFIHSGTKHACCEDECHAAYRGCPCKEGRS